MIAGRLLALRRCYVSSLGRRGASGWNQQEQSDAAEHGKGGTIVEDGPVTDPIPQRSSRPICRHQITCDYQEVAITAKSAIRSEFASEPQADPLREECSCDLSPRPLVGFITRGRSGLGRAALGSPTRVHPPSGAVALLPGPETIVPALLIWEPPIFRPAKENWDRADRGRRRPAHERNCYGLSGPSDGLPSV